MKFDLHHWNAAKLIKYCGAAAFNVLEIDECTSQE